MSFQSTKKKKKKKKISSKVLCVKLKGFFWEKIIKRND